MPILESLQRIDIFDSIEPTDTLPAWRRIGQYTSRGTRSLIKLGGYWYCCFAAKSDHVWDITVVLLSRDGLHWEDTNFPFKNADSQTEPTMCADAAGRIHLTFEDHWQRTGYCVYAGGAWGRIKPFPRFPERVLFDTKDQLLIDSHGELILMATRRNEGKLYSRRRSGEIWGEAEVLQLNTDDDLTGAVIDAEDTIHVLIHNGTTSSFRYLKRRADFSWSAAEEVPVVDARGMGLAVSPQGIPHFAVVTRSEILLLDKHELWNRRKVCPVSLGSHDIPTPVMQWLDGNQAQIFWKQNVFPVYRGKQVLCVTTSDSEVALPVNLTHDDRDEADWYVPEVCTAGDTLKLIIPNNENQRLFWFYSDTSDTTGVGYLEKWRAILRAGGQGDALSAYLGAIPLGDAGRVRQARLLSKVKEVSVESGCLCLVFENDMRLHCAPPSVTQPATDVPPTYAALAAFSGRIILSTPTRSRIVFCGMDTHGALEKAGGVKQDSAFCRALGRAGLKPGDIKASVFFDNGLCIFNPLIMNDLGEPAVCRLNAATHTVGKPLATDLGYGDLFFGLLADTILGENEVSYPPGTTFHLSHTLRDAEGELLEQSTVDDHFHHLQGYGNIVPGLARALYGKSKGDAFSLSLSPEDAYGAYDAALVRKLRRSEFLGGFTPEIGAIIELEENGRFRDWHVVHVDDTDLTVDGNHRWAGKAVHFDIEIHDIRPATLAELEDANTRVPPFPSPVSLSEGENDSDSDESNTFRQEWQSIVDNPDAPRALKAHFSFLASSDELQALLNEVFDRAKQVRIDIETLQIVFEGGFRMLCQAPFVEEPNTELPARCLEIARHHRAITLLGRQDQPLAFAGPDANGELDASLLASVAYCNAEPGSVKLAIYDHSDQIIYSPRQKSHCGDPLLNFIDHECCMVSDQYDAGVDDVFLRLLARDILGRKIAMPMLKPIAPLKVVIGGNTVALDTTEINLSNLKLETLPPEIGRLKELEILDLRNNALKSLPNEIGKLSALTELRLDGNQLIDLPETFSDLLNLEALFLNQNPIAKLPQNLGKLINLREIWVDTLPRGIGQFRNLEKLAASCISEEVGQLEELNELWIKGQHAQPFPARMPELPGLKTLWLYEMDFAKLPLAICDLASVKYLYIVRCKNLVGLPPEIAKLRNLKKICLNGCSQLAHIPEEIQSIQTLQDWSSTSAPLSQSSIANICTLSGLKYLNLEHVPLTDIAEDLPSIKKRIRSALPNCKVSF